MSSARKTKKKSIPAPKPASQSPNERTIAGIKYSYQEQHGGWVASAQDIAKVFFNRPKTAVLRFFEVQKIKLHGPYKFEGNGQKGQPQYAIDGAGLHNLGKLNPENYEKKYSDYLRAKFDNYCFKNLVKQNGVYRINLPKPNVTSAAIPAASEEMKSAPLPVQAAQAATPFPIASEHKSIPVVNPEIILAMQSAPPAPAALQPMQAPQPHIFTYPVVPHYNPFVNHFVFFAPALLLPMPVAIAGEQKQAPSDTSATAARANTREPNGKVIKHYPHDPSFRGRKI